MRQRCLGTLAATLCLGLLPTPPAGGNDASGSDAWPLWSGDTQLRGANIYQRRVYPELDGSEFMGGGTVGPPYTQADFDSLAALGANYVNISHPGLYRESPPYDLDEAVQANLDNLLQMVAEADMFAVIAFRTGPGRSEFTFFFDEVGDWFDASYLNDTVWTTQAAQDAWVEMWRHTAQRYRDKEHVVGYDLMVEPNSNEVLFDEWDPQVFTNQYGGTLYDWNQLHPRLTTAIRQVDTMTPILVGAMAYSAVDWLEYLQPTSDPRTVYIVHQYAPISYTHQDVNGTYTYPGLLDLDWDGQEDDQLDRAWLEALLDTVDDFKADHGVPVAVNEFGVVRWVPGAADFMSDQMELFEEHDMNHALWVWDPAWQPLTEENNDFNIRFGPDPPSTDNVSNDLLDAVTGSWDDNTIRPSTTVSTAASIYVPAAAHLSGTGDTHWRTDVQIKTLGDTQASFSIALLEADQDNSSPSTLSFTLAPGNSRRFEDLLSDLFAFTGSGALRITPVSGRILLSSRTYNAVTGGTYGQYIAGFTRDEAIRFGSDAEIIQLTRSADSSTGYRTNLGFVNVTAQTISVQVELYLADGSYLGTRPYPLAPYGQSQVSDIFGKVGAGEVADGYAVVRTTTQAGALLAYASVIDNLTGDPIFIPAQVVSPGTL